MKTSSLIAVGALLVGGAGGYLAGTSSRGEQERGGRDALVSKSARPASRLSGGGEGGGSGRAAKSPTSLREILAEPGQTNRIMSLLQFYADLDSSEFESEMQKLQSLPMSHRMLAMNLLFSRWAETDPQAALEQSRTMGFPEMFMARAGVVSGWAAANPEGLAKQYAENPGDFRMGGPGGRGGGETVGMIASEWAKQNPAAALEWARSLDEREQGDAIEGIFNELARQDPQTAAGMAARLSGEERREALRSIAETWAVTDYAATDAWINGLAGEEKAAARIEAVESLANVDPETAARETLKVPQGEERDDLVAEVSREWAQQDASAALDWLTESGSEAAIEEGIGRVMGRLAGQNAAKALEWIDEQPAGEMRDSAVQGYIAGNRQGQPAEQIALAESISDEGDRERVVQRVAYQWIREDKGAALDYVQSSSALSEESKERMTSMADRIEEGGGRDLGRDIRRLSR